MGVRLGVVNFFWVNPWVLMTTIYFSLNFYSSIKTVGATAPGGLWALKWAWNAADLRCVRSSGICMTILNSLAFVDSEILAFIRTNGQTDMARSTRLVILIKNIYIYICYILSDESSMPFYSTSNGYNKKMHVVCIYIIYTL